MSLKEFTILLPFIIITQIIFIYNYGSMSNQKVKMNFKYWLVILITSILLFINNYYNLLFLRFFVGILINYITSKLIFKNKNIMTLYYCIIHAIFCIFLELLLSPILMFKIDNVEILNYTIYVKCFFSILIAFLSIFIFRNKYIKIFISKVFTLLEKTNFNTLIIITLIFINIILFFRVIDLKNIEMLILTLISVIFMIISIRIIITDKYNLKLINERNKNLKDSYLAYSKTIEDCKEFKHNLKNELYSLNSLLPKDGQILLNNIIQKYNIDYKWINKIGEIPEGLQGVIYLKQKEAQRKKINIIINTEKIIKTNIEDYIDLCNIIGILLDNAIEASIKAKSKIIEILITKRKDKLNIKIINVHNNNIDLMKIGKKNYSTKEFKSGLGLNYIKNIHNSKIKVDFKIMNNIFITNIIYK